MEKNFMFVALSILAVVLVALGIFYFAGAAKGGAPTGGAVTPVSNQTQQASAEQTLFFDAIRVPANYQEYSYSYTEKASSGYYDDVLLVNKPGLSYAKKEDAIVTRQIFIVDNTTTLCMGNINREVCSTPPNNSTLGQYAYKLSALLFNPKAVEANYQMNQKLIAFGALKMNPGIQEKEYDGRKCSQISYVIDYTKLTIEQLISLGMDTSSAELLISKQYNFTLCIDPQTKDVVYKRLDYMDLGKPAYTEYYTLQSEWGTSTPVSMPSEIVNDTEMLMFYEAVKMSEQNFVACLSDNDTDSCLRAEAISSRNEKICEYINGTDMKDSCYVNIGLANKDTSICLEVTPAYTDDCYMEFAWKYLNTSYCDMMSAPEKKSNCTALVGEQIQSNEEWKSNETTAQQNQTSAKPPAGNVSATGECTKDSDCVKAGCSSEICVPSSQAGTITPCIYRSDYDCLPLSSCGCANGKCGWAQNPEYLNCLASKKSNE